MHGKQFDASYLIFVFLELPNPLWWYFNGPLHPNSAMLDMWQHHHGLTAHIGLDTPFFSWIILCSIEESNNSADIRNSSNISNVGKYLTRHFTLAPTMLHATCITWLMLVYHTSSPFNWADVTQWKPCLFTYPVLVLPMSGSRSSLLGARSVFSKHVIQRKHGNPLVKTIINLICMQPTGHS